MTQRKHLIEALALAGIIVLATVMRFGWTGVVPFAQDEANLSLAGLKMMRTGLIIPLGAFTSVGFPHFPAGSWLYALPFTFTSDPLFAAWMTGILSIAAILALWWVLRQHVSVIPALTAALFLAAEPYSPIFSRSIWQPNPMISLTTFWLISAFYAITGERRIALMTGLTVFLGGLLLQIHTAGFGILLATGYVFLRWRWWRRWKAVLAGGLLAAALTVPYFYYIACCGTEVLNLVGDFVDSPAVIDAESTIHTIQVMTGTNWQRFVTSGAVPPLPFESLMAAGVALLILMGLSQFGRDVWKKSASPRRVLAELAILVIVCMPLIFLRHSSPARAYYLLPVLPGTAILVGIATLTWGKWGRVLIVPVAVMAGIWSADVGRHLDVIGTQAVPGGISAPLSILRSAAYYFPPSVPVAYFTHGDVSSYSAQAQTFATLWWDYPQNRVLNGENLLVLPPYPGVLMAELGAIQAWEELQAAGFADEYGRIPRRQGEEDFVYVCYDGKTPPDGFTSIDPVTFEHGVTLESSKARYVGSRLRISTLWHVTGTLPVIDEHTRYQQFTHLYPADAREGQPLLVSDVAISLHTWREGDRVIVMADFFDVPAGDYVLKIGQYVLETGQRMQRSDGQGDSAEISLPDTASLIQQFDTVITGQDVPGLECNS